MKKLIFLKQSSLWKDYSFAILSGVLLWFSWPNVFWPGVSALPGWLALVAFIPYFSVWRRTGWRGNFIFAWITGFIYFLGIIYWLRLINKDTNVDNTIGWIFFAACGGIYFGCFGASARILHDRLRLPAWLVLPIAWTAWEYIRGHIITGGWPWGSLGHTQYANPILRQVAAVAGVGGVSFLVIWINYFLFAGVQRWLQHRQIKNNQPLLSFRFSKLLGSNTLSAVLSMSMILIWLFLLGALGSDLIRFNSASAQSLKVALVQGNIHTDQRWDQDYKESVMTKMAGLHARAAQAQPDIIVWAESCYPSFLEYEPEKQWEARLRALIKQHGIATVLTSNEYPRTHLLEGPEYQHFNSAFLLDEQGGIEQRYRKIKLVPGGEYIPWNWMKSFMQAVVREPIPVDFEPGTEYTVFQWHAFQFSTLICYEDQYEELAIRMARNGADFFIALSNDGWAGKSAMSAQRVAMSVFLAIEHRAYLLKAGMTGPCIMIDPWGRLGDSIPTFQSGIHQVEIQPRSFKTLYTFIGNSFSLGCLILMSAFFLGIFLVNGLRKKNV